MKRFLFACLMAILGASLIGATASAAGTEQGPAAKFHQRGNRIRVVAGMLQMTPRELLRELRDTNGELLADDLPGRVLDQRRGERR